MNAPPAGYSLAELLAVVGSMLAAFLTGAATTGWFFLKVAPPRPAAKSTDREG